VEKRKGSGLRKEALMGFVVKGLLHHSFEFNRAVKESVTAIIRLRRQLSIPRNELHKVLSRLGVVDDA